MKILRIFKTCLTTVFFLAIAALAAAFPTLEGRVIDISLDLDDTLVIREPKGTTPGVQYLLIYYDSFLDAGESYRLVDGAQEFISSLLDLKLPGLKEVRVGFRSAGSRARNIALLKALSLMGNHRSQSAYEVAIFIKSLEDAVRMDWSPSLQSRLFKGDRKKNLADFGDFATPLTEKQILMDAILIDDQKKYSMPGQEKNLLLIPNIDYDVRDGKLARDTVRHRRGFVMSRNKLAFAYGLLVHAIQGAIHSGRSVADVLWETQWDSTGPDPVYRSNVRETLTFFQVGTKSFHEQNPGYKFSGLHLPPLVKCQSIF